MWNPPKGMYATDTPQEAPKLLGKRFHQEVFQDGHEAD